MNLFKKCTRHYYVTEILRGYEIKLQENYQSLFVETKLTINKYVNGALTNMLNVQLAIESNEQFCLCLLLSFAINVDTST